MWIDAQDLAEQRLERLTIAARDMAGAAVVRTAPVAETDVQHGVRSERELAAVVIRLRLFNLEQRARSCGIHDTGAGDLVFDDAGVAGGIGVVHVEPGAVG